jgi:hypothetical protein
MKRCAGCRAVVYCSRECQKEDWPDHKQHCRDLAQDPANLLQVGRTVALKYISEHTREIVRVRARHGPDSIIKVDFTQGYAQVTAWRDRAHFVADYRDPADKTVDRLLNEKAPTQVVIVSLGRHWTYFNLA